MDIKNNECRKEQIAAYVDGELDTDARITLEQHVLECSPCNAELCAQRLFICELDLALTVIPDLPMPKNFAESVAARAENDMSGMRNKIERKRAMRLCLLLALSSFAMMGATASRSVLLSGQAIADKVLGIFALLWRALSDATVGMTVISRVISGGLVPDTPFAGLAALLLVLAVVLLSVLISSYHQQNEMWPSD